MTTRFVQVVEHNFNYECKLFEQLPDHSPPGALFYDLEEARWVKRGKSGRPVKATHHNKYWHGVLAKIIESEGSFSEDEIRQSYAESEDSFTEGDLARWSQARKTYLMMQEHIETDL
jgi:hypothetical protein